MADKDTPFVHDPSGVKRLLTALPPYDDHGGLPKFAAANVMVPREQWKDIDLSPLLHPVWDQGGYGSCVGHGSGTAFHVAYRIAGGTVPEGGFSPTSLYALVNGGRDRGAVVSDAMQALIDEGIGLRSEVPSNVIYERQIPAAAKANRKRFRIHDAFLCDSFDAIGSALQLGFPVSFGILLPARFNEINAEGVAGLGRGSLGGHCMAVYGAKRLKDGRWALRVRNSWGERFGIKGNCLLVEDHFQPRGGWPIDAFAVRCANFDPQDPHPAPIAT